MFEALGGVGGGQPRPWHLFEVITQVLDRHPTTNGGARNCVSVVVPFAPHEISATVEAIDDFGATLRS